ncbi:MAG TPA: hypothetical protein VFD71_01795 [Planctomycetota bacterium]|jgi:hypothetical protein|nr:hypothetical protein [Planctomycetota bacterium]
MTDRQDKYLYSIMYPNYGLVASMLPPDEFGKHYTIGSSRYFHGQVIFAEIDINFRHPFFPIDEVLREVKPKADGSPKRTKFVKTYRVLEHLDLNAFRSLYITTAAGRVLELERKSYNRAHKQGLIRTFQEICPFSYILLTYMTPPEFGKYITEPENEAKGAPKVMFTQIELNIEKFLREIEDNPFMSSPIPNVHPHKLRDQILELRSNPEKRIKGVSLDSALSHLSFLKLRTGFWISAPNEFLYYPIPDKDTLQKEHPQWYKSLSQ